MNNSKTHKIVLMDTNFLLLPAQFGVDIFSEMQRLLSNYSLAIVDKTLVELDRIIEKGTQNDKTAAKIARKMLTMHEHITIPTGDGHVDDLIVEYIYNQYQNGVDTVLATQDRDLRRRAKPYSGLIAMRQKNHLEIIK
ncbi:hypothetical protein K9M79_00695 [Candidatus Woesearchaeota archaeon]|nr:hypothetical protein [Candidatus Woesearchaeota archaeon]